MIAEETCASHALSSAKIMPDNSKQTPHPEELAKQASRRMGHRTEKRSA
jgi:hypothetical protein